MAKPTEGVAKPTWVFVAGTYRTGSTTHYRMCRDIVEEIKQGIGIGYHTEGKLQQYDKHDHRCIVCKVFKYLPETSPHGKRFLAEHRLKSILTIRDPRDIITSMRAREEGRKRPSQKEQWDFNTTAITNLPKWLDQLTQWIDLGPNLTLVTKYEDMIVNLSREVKRIARHLDISIPPEKVGEIAKRYTITAQRDYARKCKEDDKRPDPYLPGIPDIRFGTSGTYHTWLSQPEVRVVEDSNRKFMERFGYL